MGYVRLISAYFLSVSLLFSCTGTHKQDTGKKNSPSGEIKKSFVAYGTFPKKFIREMESFLPPGFDGTLLFYRDGLLYCKAYGYKDYEKKEKMDKGCLFQLASVSKPVTAACILILAQEQRLHPDSPVVKYMKDFPYPGVTVRHLLMHRSGIPEYTFHADTLGRSNSAPVDNDYFTSFMRHLKIPPYAKPGEVFRYCNSNFAYLAALVGLISDTPFHVFAQKRIFEPAGMQSSFFNGHVPNHALSRVLLGRVEKKPYKNHYPSDGILGDKSMYSTAEDLLRFHLALSDGTLLQPYWLGQMQSGLSTGLKGRGYGMGFRLVELPSGQWTYHNGWWRGFWTSFWNRFDKKVCLVILTNNKRSSQTDKSAMAELLLKGPEK